MSAQLALPSATFAWANVPNMTACAPATISWTYTGPPQTVAIGTNPASNLSLLVDAALQNYTIPLVRLRPGEYAMTVTVGGDQSSDEEMLRRVAPFVVDGEDTACLTKRMSRRDTSSSTSDDTSSSQKGALFGGIAVGVGGVVALLTAGFYFRWGHIWKKLRRKHKEGKPDLPEYAAPWNQYPSQVASVAGSVSEQHLLSSRAMGDLEMQMASSNPSAVTLPRLEPNRRPPSTVMDVAMVVPLPRLEPNRRKPSVRNLPHVAPSQEPIPPVPPPQSHTPPIPTRTPSPPKVDLEAEFKPMPRQPPPIPAPILLGTPKPPQRNTRHSATSAYTSASTALSDMPLLKPGTRTSAQIELQRALALAKLDTMKNHPHQYPYPVPTVPLPVATPPPPSPSPTATSTVFSTRPPTPPSPAHTATPRASTLALSPASTSYTYLRSPTSPRIQALQAQASQSVSRSGSTRSNASRRSRRKPVPPLDPSDATSEMWSAPRSSFESARTAMTTTRGSPVPSSSTSQMYRIRDSAWSEWTWTRPMENWEREQLRVLASVMAVDDNGDGMGVGMGSPPVPPAGGAGPGPGAKGTKNLRHQSFGEMKAMRSVVPDSLPAPSRTNTR